jgi:hypothetical protein
MRKPKLNPINVLWRHLSAWALWGLAVLGVAWTALPDYRDDLPPWVASALAVAGLLGKVIAQAPPPPGGDR